MAKIQTLNFQLSKEELKYFIEIIKEYNKISEIQKIKFIGDKVMLYTLGLANDTSSIVNLIKTHILDKKYLFSNIPSNFENSFVIFDGKTMIQEMNLLLEDDSKMIDIEIKYISDNIYSIEYCNSEYSLTTISGEQSIIKDISLSVMQSKLDIRFADGSFKLKSDYIKKILKSAMCDKKTELIAIHVKDNKVYFVGERWKLKVDDIEKSNNRVYNFDKKYLKSIITKNDFVDMYLFENYIIMKDDNSHFLFNLSI